MIAFFLRLRHEVGEAIDHHAGLGDDADDDAQDVCSCRDKAIREEEPDGVDAERDVEQDADHEAGVVLAPEEEEHHDVGRGVQRGVVGRPQSPVGAEVVREDAGERQQDVHQGDVDPERADLRQRLVATCGAHHVAVEEVEEAAGQHVLLELVRPVERALQPDECQGDALRGVAAHVEPDEDKCVECEEGRGLHPVLVEPV